MVCFLLLSGLICWSDSSSITRSKKTSTRPQITTLMYMTARQASIQSFRTHAGQISIIAPQSFTMDAQGFVTGEVPASVLEIARARNVAIMPLVTNRGFSQELMHSLLDSPESRARVIRYLMFYALRDGYIGFQFDCEHINKSYRKRFTSFLRETSREFHKQHLLVSAAVIGRYSDGHDADSPGGFENWSGVYDYAALAKEVDFISVMAYPEHAAFSGPGPLAGLPWVKRILDYALDSVPAKKISLAVPTYGIRWTSEGARWKAATAAWPDVLPELLKVYTPDWDQVEKAHHFEFAVPCSAQTVPATTGESDEATLSPQPSDRVERKVVGQWNADERATSKAACSGERSVVWFEDAESLGYKLRLATSKELGWGVSGWVLGMEDPGFWIALEQDYHVAHPKTPKVEGSYEERAKSAAKRVRLNKAELAAASAAGL